MKYTPEQVTKIREVRSAMNKKPDKIREWRKRRGIKEEIGETVLEHTNKVMTAAHIYGLRHPELDLDKMLAMARCHDVAEYKEKDYLPLKYGWEIDLNEKHAREKAVMMELRDFCGEEGQKMFDIWMEYEKQETPEAKIVKQLDKLDGMVQAMEYEKLWYDNVTNFYPDALENVYDPILSKILKILLKKEYYPQINAYEQYFTLLQCDGDEEIFKKKMESKLSG